MPATSRQGESGRTRSASGLAGSPSKSTIFQPLTVRRVWPRWRSPCTCWTCGVPARRRGRERRAQAVGVRSPGRARRRARRRAGRVIAAASRPAASAVRPWVGKCSARTCVHLGQRLAEARGLAGEVAPHLVGVQVGLGEQVADAGQGERPSRRWPCAGTAGASPAGAVAVGLDGLEPAVEVGDVVGPGLGEHLVDRDVGVARPGVTLRNTFSRRPRRRRARSCTARR